MAAENHVTDIFKVFPSDPQYNNPRVNQTFAEFANTYPMGAQPVDLLAKWFWRVRRWTATDNQAPADAHFVMGGGIDNPANAGGFAGRPANPDFPDLYFPDLYFPDPQDGALELVNEFDIWIRRKNLTYFGVGLDDIVGASTCQFSLMNEGGLTLVTAPVLIEGENYFPQCYCEYRNLKTVSPGWLATTGNTLAPAAVYPCVFLIDGVSVPGTVTASSFAVDPLLVIAIDPYEFWSYDGKYDTTTGVEL